MLGWKDRYLFVTPPFFMPQGIRVEEIPFERNSPRVPFLFICLFLTFILSTGSRLLEIPYWDNPAYRMGNEYLLATHDAYHWVAGAEGFEFGTGHPMSEFARILSEITDIPPAQVAFWLPPVMGGLLAVGVWLWGWGLGYPFAGCCAGVLSSLAPAFCARTLLGFYDTDLIILLFPLLFGLIPALWLNPWLISPLELLWRLPVGLFAKKIRLNRNSSQETTKEKMPFCLRRIVDVLPSICRRQWFFGNNAAIPGAFSMSATEMRGSVFAWPWISLLILSGVFGHWTESWHSLFPYLTRFATLSLPLLILILGPAGGRRLLLSASLCYALPMLCGFKGVIASLVYCALLHLTWRAAGQAPDASGRLCRLFLYLFRHNLLQEKIFLAVAWIGTISIVLDSAVYDIMMQSFAAYSNRSGDISQASAITRDPLMFPSVAQSIIEVQTIALPEFFVYIYPIEIISIIAFILFLYRLSLTPAMIWFIPLLALSLLSLKMGARMILFATPALMLSLCMEGGLFLEYSFFRLILPRISRAYRQDTGKSATGFAPSAKDTSLRKEAIQLTACLICTVCLTWPLIILLPDYTQGPIISKNQATALMFIKDNTEEDSFIWNWWDWGYATHHFARRHTIADGARHGGPSLFLPAAVYTTADPRFARQIIKYTATKGNIPGNVFADLSASQAQQLMRDLGNRHTPLITAPGKQYVVVSLELLRLGLWITRYGSWNFESRQSSGSLINNLSQAMEFNVDTGIIQPEKSQPVYAGSIDIFGSKGLERRSYNRYGAYHFIFNTQTSTFDKTGNRTANLIESFWKIQRGNAPSSIMVNDKIVLDDVFYNTMMVQLLLCPKDDPGIAPYFRLVFDNMYARVFEVL
ncbi:MAG: hypothetical protein LBD42_06690 [Desulfovibrio sp.]|jgi:dolichyl-diphosphooligosaccharide--protein glycosyltransferase|nr:hypothetical protein [Desulfovibrio sp.]